MFVFSWSVRPAAFLRYFAELRPSLSPDYTVTLGTTPRGAPKIRFDRAVGIAGGDSLCAQAALRRVDHRRTWGGGLALGVSLRTPRRPSTASAVRPGVIYTMRTACGELVSDGGNTLRDAKRIRLVGVRSRLSSGPLVPTRSQVYGTLWRYPAPHHNPAWPGGHPGTRRASRFVSRELAKRFRDVQRNPQMLR